MDDRTRARLRALAEEKLQDANACHRADHVVRVVNLAMSLAEHYPDIDREALEAAAWLHDIGRGCRRGPEVSHADASAQAARDILPELGFTPAQIAVICQAIADHRFSGGRAAETLEGRLLQDADRLDALGAIGIARTFAEGGSRSLYHPEDPLAQLRAPDDSRYTLDHFFRKLLTLASAMHTPEARAIARRRTHIMRKFLRDFSDEIGFPGR